MSEVVVVNENDEVVGTVSREEAHRKGVPHRISVVYVENSKGEILVQVRMTGRLDHSSAGHVDPGEEYIETARRELFEELGIEGVSLKSIGKGVSREDTGAENRVHFFEVFVCLAEPKKLQEGEVKEVYWADPDKIQTDMDKDTTGKFGGGFLVSLPIYLKYKNNL